MGLVNKRMVLFLLAALNFTHILDFMVMMPLGNYLMPYFRITPKQFSWLVSAYTLSAALSGFLAAFFADRYDRRKLLLFAYGGFLVGTLLCGIAPGYSALLIARIVAGIFGGMIGAQVLSILSDLFPYEERGKAMGVVISAFSVASTLGIPFSLYLANLISWHAPFLFIVITGAVIYPLLMRSIPPMSAHLADAPVHTDRFEALRSLMADRRRQLALLFSLLWYMGHFLIIPFINPMLEFNMGFSKLQTPMIYLVGGIVSFFAANYFGKLSDQMGKLKIFSICMLITFLFIFLITHLPPLPFGIVLFFFASWFIFSTGRGVAAQALLSNVVPVQQRGSFMSFNSSVQSLGTGLASFLAGMVVTADASGKLSGYSGLGWVSIGLLALALLLARTLFRQEPAV